jgi:hypothetical protein
MNSILESIDRNFDGMPALLIMLFAITLVLSISRLMYRIEYYEGKIVKKIHNNLSGLQDFDHFVTILDLQTEQTKLIQVTEDLYNKLQIDEKYLFKVVHFKVTNEVVHGKIITII